MAMPMGNGEAPGDVESETLGVADGFVVDGLEEGVANGEFVELAEGESLLDWEKANLMEKHWAMQKVRHVD